MFVVFFLFVLFVLDHQSSNSVVEVECFTATTTTITPSFRTTAATTSTLDGTPPPTTITVAVTALSSGSSLAQPHHYYPFPQWQRQRCPHVPSALLASTKIELELEPETTESTPNTPTDQEKQLPQNNHHHHNNQNTTNREEVTTRPSPSLITTTKSTTTTTTTTNAPLLISIAPPCSEKDGAITSYLRYRYTTANATTNKHQQQLPAYDSMNVRKQVSLGADGGLLYHRIPIAAFLYPTSHLTPDIGNTILYDDITVRDRLLGLAATAGTGTAQTSHRSQRQQKKRTTMLQNEQRTDLELRTIVLRLSGRITSEQFATQLRLLVYDAGDTVEYFKQRRIQIYQDLLAAVEEVAIEAIGEVLVQLDQQEQEQTQAQQAQEIPKEEQGDDGEEELPYISGGIDTTTSTLEELESLLSPTSSSSSASSSAHLLSARALIKTPYVEVYVKQAIFEKGGGIDRAEKELISLTTTGKEQEEEAQDKNEDKDQTKNNGNNKNKNNKNKPIAWKQTNTRPMEYIPALEAAERSNRPVKFIWWGMEILEILPEEKDMVNTTTSTVTNGVVDIMPRVSRKELLKRNIRNFRNTGRYIPAGAIGGSLDRVEDFIDTARKIATKAAGRAAKEQQEETITIIEPEQQQQQKEDTSTTTTATTTMMDRAFAYLGGYHIDMETGLVQKVGDCKVLGQPFDKKRTTFRNSKKSSRGSSDTSKRSTTGQRPNHNNHNNKKRTNK